MLVKKCVWLKFLQMDKTTSTLLKIRAQIYETVISHWNFKLALNFINKIFLFFQDLIRSLEITNSVRPARSRFCGQGYINCLTEISRQASGGSSQRVTERDDWRYRTDRLAGLLQVGSTSVDQVQRSIKTLDRLELDPTFQSPKLQVGF